MTANGFRRIALGLKGAVESAHMGHPDFRVNSRIFATLKADGRHGMVKLTPDDQARFIGDAPDAFAPEAGAWGRAGCTRVRLAAVSEETLGEALTVAWRSVAQTVARPARRSRVPRR